MADSLVAFASASAFARTVHGGVSVQMGTVALPKSRDSYKQEDCPPNSLVGVFYRVFTHLSTSATDSTWLLFGSIARKTVRRLDREAASEPICRFDSEERACGASV